jgi:Ni/Fe-hydrogenase 1 B-type cytochrome subunit
MTYTPTLRNLAPEDAATVSRQTSVHVHEAPVRLWHLVNAGAILVLIVTGYLVASPSPTVIIGGA